MIRFNLLSAARLLSLAALLALTPPARPDTPPQSNWSIQVLQESDGLPSNNVYDLTQTPDGYLWAATASGLARFDGVTFQTLSFPPPFNQRTPSIGALNTSAAGGLLVAVSRVGLLRMNPGQPLELYTQLPEIAPAETVATQILEDTHADIWMPIRYHDVIHAANGKTDHLGSDAGIPPGTADLALVQDAHGRLWASKGDWIGRLQDGHFQRVIQIPAGRLRAAAASGDGLWITNGPNLLRSDLSGALTPRGTIPGPDAEVTTLMEDRSGVLWIGTAYRGLFRFDGISFENVPTSHPHVCCLLEDRDRNIWVGTRGGGLDRVQPRAILLQGDEAGLPVQSIQSIAEDTAGTLWAVTQDGGLRHLANDSWILDSANPNWPGGAATCVTADDSGAVWIGTRNYQLYRWKNQQYTTWSRQDGIANRSISGLYAAKNGDLWIAEQMKDSLCRLRDGKIVSFPFPENVRHIRAIGENPAGRVWIGTDKGTLLQVDGDTLVDRTALIKPSVEMIRACYWAPDGALWISAGRAGLVRFKDGAVTSVNESRGLFDSRIFQMIADNRGWLWCCSTAGIFKVRLQELNEVADGARPRLQSVHYGQDQGLPSLEPGFGLTARPLRTRDGRLWMLMGTALAIVSPEKVREQMQPPPVHLERITADDKVIASYHSALPAADGFDLQQFSKGLLLEPRTQRLEFDFTAVSFEAPANVRFQYRLDGVDDQWLDGGTHRTAVYSKLSAGDYQFHVRACNSDGLWNEQGSTLAFTVKPLVWQTWWFQSLAALAFTGLVAALARYVSFRRLRMRLRLLEQQTALHKERARIARDLHDDLGARLTKIVMLSDMSHRENGQGAADRAQQISSAARQSIKSLDETVWAVNPRNDTLPHLIDYVGQFAAEFLRAAGIRCRVDLLENSPDRPVSADVRHHVLLVVKEVLNNIVRHAAATEVWLRISLDADFICLTIEDNGRGFVLPDDGNGDADPNADGLRNIAHRMHEIGGRSQIRSQPGAGTRVSLIFPWSSKELSPL